MAKPTKKPSHPPAAVPLSQRLSRWTVITAVAATAFVFSDKTSAPLVDPKWLAAELSASLLLLLCAFNSQLLGNPSASNHTKPALLGLVLMIFAAILSCFFAPEKTIAFHALPRALTGLAWGAMILVIPWRENDFRKIARAFIVIGAIISGIGILQYYFPEAMHEFLPFGHASQFGRMKILSTIGNPEYLAGFIMPIAILALWEGICCPRGRDVPRERRSLDLRVSFSNFHASRETQEAMPNCPRFSKVSILWFLLLAIMLKAMALAEARGALGGFAIGAILIAVFVYVEYRHTAKTLSPSNIPSPDCQTKPSHKIWIAAAVTAAILLLILLGNHRSLLNRFSQSLDTKSVSVEGRILIYTVATDMIRTNGIMGLGPDGFNNTYYLHMAKMWKPAPKQTPPADIQSLSSVAWKFGNLIPQHAHCDPLEFWVEFGILGFAGFALVAASVFAAAIALFRRTALFDFPSSTVVRAGFIAAAVACLAYSMVAFPFHAPDRALLYWSILALSIGALIEKEQSLPAKSH